MNKQMVGVFLALVTMIVARVGAADLYWSANGTTQGGAGTWNTSDTRWGSSAGGPFGATWNNGNTVTAIFGGTAGTVTLGVSITNGGLQFNTTGYTISIGANNLAFGAADNAITLNNIGTATITGTVGGTGNVIVSSSNPATPTILMPLIPP